MDSYDVIIIGAGISGLTTAALLAKRGKRVLVVEATNKPGGSCGIFKRNDTIFEQGSSMLYGFGEQGFNPHRYVFNVLEEPITMIKHEHLYAIHFGNEKIIFYEELERFLTELIRVFPKEEKGIRRFYQDFGELYQKVIIDTPLFVSPDVLSKEQAKEQFLNHPWSYLKFLTYMNRSMKGVLRKYFRGNEILEFFDKLTSTYCYATVEEAPAVLGAVMFLDNHYGGSYYPAGSTHYFIGKLEKVIEENNGVICYGKEVTQIIVADNIARGVKTSDGKEYHSKAIVYSGNIWALYDRLLSTMCDRDYEPTYSSVVFYALVKKEAVPEDALPIEMFITNKSAIDESEITVYLYSLDDQTLCDADHQVLVAIGPSFSIWPDGYKGWYRSKLYRQKKIEEKQRIISLLENRYHGLKDAIVYSELATPSTLVHYVKKYKGSVAGPKQMIGQHMLKRQHTKTKIEGLYCCGEGTVMGTGTPAVTVSAIAAANIVLRESGQIEYSDLDNKKEYVTIVTPPFTPKDIKVSEVKAVDSLAKNAMKCQFCNHPACQKKCPVKMDIRGINRRASVGNITGAYRRIEKNQAIYCQCCEQMYCQKACKRAEFDEPVQIKEIMKSVLGLGGGMK